MINDDFGSKLKGIRAGRVQATGFAINDDYRIENRNKPRNKIRTEVWGMEISFAMKKKIAAGIVTIWGGGMVVGGLFIAPPSGKSAYSSEQMISFVYGAVIFFIGIYYLVKKEG